MMDEIIRGTAERVPALLLFCIIVYVIVKMFMNHLERSRERDEAIAERCHNSHEKVIAECNKTLNRSSSVIQENTRVMGKVCMLLDRKNGGS